MTVVKQIFSDDFEKLRNFKKLDLNNAKESLSFYVPSPIPSMCFIFILLNKMMVKRGLMISAI